MMKIASLLALKECFRNVGTKGAKTSRGCFRGSKLTRCDHTIKFSYNLKTFMLWLTRLLEDSIMPAESSMRRGRACSSVMVTF